MRAFFHSRFIRKQCFNKFSDNIHCIQALHQKVKLFLSHRTRSGLAAGVAIGIVGDVGTRALGQQPKLFVGMILILIFAEVRILKVCICIYNQGSASEPEMGNTRRSEVQ